VDEGRCGLSLGQHEHHALVDGAARQVVQEAQGRLIGVVQVIHHQQQTGSRGCYAHELGGGDEQPLVAVLSRPAQVLPGQRAFDLGAVVVTQPVEQGWVATAEGAQRFEHGCVGPRTLDRGGATAGHLPPLPPGQDLRQVEDGGLPDPGRAHDQQRHASPGSGLFQDGADPVTHVLATEQADSRAAVGRRRRRRE
jgi:hypothetical protein